MTSDWLPHQVPLNVEEATASLATMVVVSILDDASRRHRERREKASGRERGSFRKSEEVTKLELELLEMSTEFEAAELAEINLVEAFCVPVLTASLKPPSPPPTPPPNAFASTPATTPATAPTTAAMSTFCRCLLECRDPFDGRNLLLLACGAGSSLLVDLLLTHGERSRGAFNCMLIASLFRCSDTPRLSAC